MFGGSWGSTLAIAYAEEHPARCLGLMLRGICLMQKHEIDWFLYGIRIFFPEAWENFAHFVPPDERRDLLAAYGRIFAGDDDVRKRDAIRIWANYESTCSVLLPSMPIHAKRQATISTGLALR